MTILRLGVCFNFLTIFRLGVCFNFLAILRLGVCFNFLTILRLGVVMGGTMGTGTFKPEKNLVFFRIKSPGPHRCHTGKLE